MKAAFLMLVAAALAVACAHTSPHLVGARYGTPNSWLVPNWYVDASNASRCASDTNSGQSASCGEAGVGPVAHYAQVVSLWGTTEPSLSQATTLTFMSDDPESIVIAPSVLAPSGMLSVVGTLTQVGSGTVGAVTAKSWTTDQLLNANLGQSVAPFQGLMFVDATRSSVAWVDKANGNVAVLTQPLTQKTTDCEPTYGSGGELDTVTPGDAYTIQRPSIIGLRQWAPVCHAGANTFPQCACLRNAWVSDPSGTPSVSATDLSLNSNAAQVRFDTNLMFRQQQMLQEPSAYWNIYANGAMQNNLESQSFPVIVGGAVYTSNAQGSNVASNGQFILDGDIIVHGFALLAGPDNFIGAAYFDGSVNVTGLLQIKANYTAARAWGPSRMSLFPRTTVLYSTSTFAGAFFMGGGIGIDAISAAVTASAYDQSTGLWHAGRTLSVANIDLPISSGGFSGAAISPALNVAITNAQ